MIREAQVPPSWTMGLDTIGVCSRGNLSIAFFFHVKIYQLKSTRLTLIKREAVVQASLKQIYDLVQGSDQESN